MTGLIVVGAYVVCGAVCAAHRAYVEPRLARDYYLSRGWRCLLEERGDSVHTFDYPEVLVVCFLAWPIVLPIRAFGELFRGIETRGRARLKREVEAQREEEIRESEIERIIREARL